MTNKSDDGDDAGDNHKNTMSKQLYQINGVPNKRKKRLKKVREMSVPRGSSTESNKALQVKEGAVVASSSSSSWNTLTNSFPPNFPLHKRSKIEESDEDLFTVPDVEGTAANVECVTNGNKMKQSNSLTVTTEQAPQFQTKRRRGRNPADKECRRLKRLLRNRVSAQQARERKKVYVNELESRAKELQDQNSKLEERISTLINENTMLRKVLMNTRPKADDTNEPKQDQLSKS
ncbi:transcription factor HY5-like isoform X1 [Senna tora]|uniref:Transcription factor HY5 n=1 Tax=Senna tora TaxID=362788 RepID=A0A834TSM7_9FABA|nr:transcription factor HY5-like isoform X1 [Senna tora]